MPCSPAAGATGEATAAAANIATAIAVVLAALFAGLFPLNVLGELISVGILLAFTVVCIGVLVLRKTQPDRPRPFRVPLAPVTCTLGAIVCLGLSLTLFLQEGTTLRVVIWSAIGFAIYGAYGYRHSKLRAQEK